MSKLLDGGRAGGAMLGADTEVGTGPRASPPFSRVFGRPPALPGSSFGRARTAFAVRARHLLWAGFSVARAECLTSTEHELPRDRWRRLHRISCRGRPGGPGRPGDRDRQPV